MFNRFTMQRPTVPPEKLRVPMGVSPLVSEAGFPELGQRIIDLLIATSDWQADALWKPIVNSMHAPLINLVRQGKAVELCQTLMNMQFNNLAFGMGWGSQERNDFTHDGAYNAMVRAGFIENLTGVAAMLGLVQMENPEAGQQGQMALTDAAELAGRLDRFLGYELRSPCGFAQNLGIQRPSGSVLDYRTLWALATSERILGLLRLLEIPPHRAHVLEIGGGVGNLAIQCLRRGIGKYTLVDIPTTRAIQYYVTQMEFPDREIATSPGPGDHLALILPADLRKVPDRSVTIVVNEDGLPEYNADVGRSYLAEARRVCRGFFLSLNHDAGHDVAGHTHTRVSELAKDDLELICRSPHWMRKGYVEEVFRPRALTIGHEH